MNSDVLDTIEAALIEIRDRYKRIAEQCVDGAEQCVDGSAMQQSHNVFAQRHDAALAEIARLREAGLVVNEYQLPGDSRRTGGYTLRRMEQRDGTDKWAVYDGGNVVLSKEYEDGDPWEYEPLPSSRDEEYLARCRYESMEEALQHWHEWLRRTQAGRQDGE